jgi:hypothetical protein
MRNRNIVISLCSLARLLGLTQLSYAEDSAKSAQQPQTQNPTLAEKVRDISPNRKFAMRLSYDAEMYQKMFPAEKSHAGKTSSELERGIREEYFASTIKKIDLVSLPQKLVVAGLPWDGSAEQTSLTWSRDSKWCAFYASTSRWGLTWSYHLGGDKFAPRKRIRATVCRRRRARDFVGNAT